jgi:hypothetical protein
MRVRAARRSRSVLDRIHDQALFLNGTQTLEGITDDNRIKMAAVTTDLDLGTGEAGPDQLCYCFCLHGFAFYSSRLALVARVYR